MSNTVTVPQKPKYKDIELVSGGLSRTYRILHKDTRRYFLMKVAVKADDGPLELLRPPKIVHEGLVTWTIRKFRTLEKSGALRELGINILPAEIGESSYSLTEFPNQEKRDNAIEYIWRAAWPRLLTDKKLYESTVSDVAAAQRTEKKTVKAWIAAQAFYQHRNAQIPHFWLQGGPGIGRRLQRDTKPKSKALGGPRHAQRLNPETENKSRQAPQWFVDKWLDYAEAQGRTDDSLKVIYNRFCSEAYWKSKEAGDDGTGLKFVSEKNKLPEQKYMASLAYERWRAVAIDKERARRLDPNYPRQLSGGSTQDFVEAGDFLYEMDGALADNFVRFANKALFVRGQDRPTILLCVDRFSTAIVGWYVTWRPEDANSYLALAFSAFTPKDFELEKWELPPDLPGMVFGCASSVLIDRGSGRSKVVVVSIVKKLGIPLLIANPGDPEAKPHVERTIGLMKRAMEHMPGAIKPIGDDYLDKKQYEAARASGGVDFTVFMQELIKAISTKNTTPDAKLYRTVEMRDEMMRLGLPPTPAGAFEYSKSLLTGDEDWNLSEFELFTQFCTTKSRSVKEGQVNWGTGRYFSSPALRSYVNLLKRENSNMEIKITVHRTPICPLTLWWIGPEGQLLELDATPTTARRFGNSTVEWHDIINMSDTASVQKVERDAAAGVGKKSNTALLSRVRAGKIDSIVRNSNVAVAAGAVDARTAKSIATTVRQQEDEVALRNHFNTQVPNVPARAPVTATSPSRPTDNSRGEDDDDDDFLAPVVYRRKLGSE